MSKKKIIVILLFIFVGLFMFSYDSPGDGIKEKPVENIQSEEVPEVIAPVINNNYEKYPIAKEGWEAPIITIEPARVVIFFGDDYNIMTGVKVESIEELEVTVDITDTTVLEVGNHTVTYTVIDSKGNSALANRIIVVLDPNGDEDSDGFTNYEELVDPKEPEDPTKPESPENPLVPTEPTDPFDPESHPETYPPTITLIGSNPYLMLLGDEYVEEGYEITLDPHDTITTLEDVIITGEINKDELGTYELTYEITDRYGKSADTTREVKVLDPLGDDDNDGYTNEEELEDEKNPLDEEETPDYQPNPTININSCSTSMVVYDQIPDFKDCVIVTDEFYGTEGVTFDVNIGNINKNQYGTYKVIVTAYDNLNNKTEKKFDFEVLKRKVTVKIDDKTSVYLDEIKEFTSNSEDVAISGTNIGVKLSSIVTNTSNVGTYDITGTWTNDNYDVTFENGIYTITKKELKEKDLGRTKFEDGSFVYDGTLKTITVTGLKEEFTVEYENNTKTNVGIKEATAIITGNENYTGTVTLKATIEITKAPVTLTADNKTKVYGTLDEELTYKLTSGKIYEGDNLNIELSRELGENVGDYLIIITAENNNYNITLENGIYTITKKELSANDITWDKLTFIYNGKEQKPVATIKGIDGNNIILPVTIKEGKVSIDAGDYVAIAQIPENYKIEDSINEKQFTINPLRVTVNWLGDSFEYNGKEQKPTATYKDINNNEISLIVTPNKESVNAGNYVATASGLLDSNYELNESTLTHNYTITKKIIDANDITWGELEFIYNGKEQKPAATIVGVDGNDIELDVISNKNSKNVGDYIATAQDLENYEINGNSTKEFKINPKEINVSWGMTTFEYDGKSHVPTATVDTGITGESVELIVAGEQINTGVYTATASMKTPNPNYALKNTTTEFIISKIVISRDDITWGELEFIYNGNEQKPTASIEGPGGLTINLEVTVNETPINAGNYVATAQIPTNFIIEDGANEKEFTIAKKEITATWTNLEFDYDGNIHKPIATINEEDIIAGDIVNITISGEQSSVGQHIATATLSNSNYELTNSTQEFVINNVIIVNGTSTAIASGEGKEAEPGEKVDYEITLTPLGEGDVNLSTYTIELEEGLTLDACPSNAICNGNVITWTPTSIDEKLKYSATVSENTKAGDILTTTIKENSEVIATIDTKVEITVKVVSREVKSASTEIVLTLDVSTSMLEGTSCKLTWQGYACSSTRIDDLISTSKEFVENLVESNVSESEIKLTIITFGRLKSNQEGTCKYGNYSGCHEQVYSGLLTAQSLENIKTILNGIKNEDEPGGTPIYGALERANTVLSNSTKDSKYLIVLSDGDPNPNSDPNNIVNTLSSSNYNIYSIGFGIDNNIIAQNVLKKIAKNDSTHYFGASDADSLSVAFGTINDDIGSDMQTKNGKISTSTTDAVKIILSYTENGVSKEYTIEDLNNTATLSQHFISIVEGNFVWDISNYSNSKDFVMIIQY